ncbi:hypothetical protein LBWT_X3190 (plasmid) [Leptolyngbya boryana IAM M-101]|nr:hypothetical protein LBWT_X3190 [Leptolyngbya boryana IAM M-101]BAS66595.1 hypothetical protein LBDG_X3190 [Leptolyngbya boryana dg5]
MSAGAFFFHHKLTPALLVSPDLKKGETGGCFVIKASS